MLKKLIRKPLTWIVTGALVVVAAFGLYWFQPWKLFVDERVDEALPELVENDPDDVARDDRETPQGPTLVAEGEFVSQEHETIGVARIIANPDGGHQLVIEGLETSNGPDLKVWLTDQPVDADEWFVYDDGYYADLGALKGNQGDQVYDIDPDVRLDDVTSVSIWCARFSVSFGAALLS